MLYVISILIENGRFVREALCGVLVDVTERRGREEDGDEESLGFWGRGGRQLRAPSTSIWKKISTFIPLEYDDEIDDDYEQTLNPHPFPSYPSSIYPSIFIQSITHS